MIYRSWQVEQPQVAAVDALQQQTGLPQLVCSVLAARGKTKPQDWQDMVGASAALSSPALLLNMEKAVARILQAVDGGERIIVYGDYDVDGVTATALLYTYLDSIGAEVYYKLPNREDDGYGLSVGAVEQLAAKNVTLIITVDNGVSAYDAVARAAELGVDVIVTDHHLPPEILPPAVAVIDPQLPGDESPCKALCGAGVAFKLVCALEGCPPEEMLPFYGDLAAIGTVADMMPLQGENRTIVKAGLALLQQTERPGIAALLESCGLAGKTIAADNISFGISPRLNAAGRMDSAAAALELLLCEDEEDAKTRVAALEQQNAARQKTEQEITQQVIADIEADPAYQAQRILVVAGKGYHQGVIGIVASRIVERFGKPAIIISIEETTGEGKGSGRSFGDVSLYHAIAACEDVLLRFGGHAMAAGLSVREENIQAFRTAINEWAAQNHPTIHRPALQMDACVQLGALTAQSVQALDSLAPFGTGNPTPLFLVENAVIESVVPLSEGKHCRLRLRQGGGVLSAALFGTAPQALAYRPGDAVDVALSLSVFEGKTGTMLSGRIKALRPAGLTQIYLQGTELYEAFTCRGVLTKEQYASLLPAREDTVQVYRAIGAAQGGILEQDLCPLFASLGAQRSGKILVALQALCELELVQCILNEAGAPVYRLMPHAGPKKDLASAPVLQQLERLCV